MQNSLYLPLQIICIFSFPQIYFRCVLNQAGSRLFSATKHKKGGIWKGAGKHQSKLGASARKHSGAGARAGAVNVHLKSTVSSTKSFWFTLTVSGKRLISQEILPHGNYQIKDGKVMWGWNSSRSTRLIGYREISPTLPGLILESTPEFLDS